MATRERGFTLIEILVVITIIAGLMGLGFVLFGKAGEVRDDTITKTRLDGIRSALERLKSPNLLGEYPSASFERLRGLEGESVGEQIGTPNETNLGIECVYVAIYLQGHSVTIEGLGDEWLGNTDKDHMAANPTRAEKSDLYEFVDAWRNPFAYFSTQEYKNADAVSKYVMSTGEVVEAKPWKLKKTGLFAAGGSYQLFSAGMDGIFNTKDDIKSWK